MAAYLIADLDITDPELFAQYRERVPAVIAAHGGRYLARGGPLEVLEGTWKPNRAVIVEFPDMASLKRFWASPEYQPLIEMRQRSTRSRVVALEGV